MDKFKSFDTSCRKSVTYSGDQFPYRTDFLKFDRNLRELSIETANSQIVTDICASLAFNATLETLELKSFFLMHVKILSRDIHIFDNLLCTSKLRCLVFQHINFQGLDPNTTLGLDHNASLEKLKLMFCKIPDVRNIVKALKYNQTLQKIYISDDCNDISFSEELAEMLAYNHSLESLDLSVSPRDKRKNADSYHVVYRALRHNQSLRKLRLASTRFNNETAKIVGEMLMHNKSLRKFELFDDVDPCMLFTILSGLAFNASLEYITIFCFDITISKESETKYRNIFDSNRSLKDAYILFNTCLKKIYEPYLERNRIMADSSESRFIL